MINFIEICKIDFAEYLDDLNKKVEDINFNDLKFIFNELKTFLKNKDI